MRIPVEVFVPLVIVFGVFSFGCGILYMQYQRLREAEQKAKQSIETFSNVQGQIWEEHKAKWERLTRKWEELEKSAEEQLVAEEVDELRKRWGEIEREAWEVDKK